MLQDDDLDAEASVEMQKVLDEIELDKIQLLRSSQSSPFCDVGRHSATSSTTMQSQLSPADSLVSSSQEASRFTHTRPEVGASNQLWRQQSHTTQVPDSYLTHVPRQQSHTTQVPDSYLAHVPRQESHATCVPRQDSHMTNIPGKPQSWRDAQFRPGASYQSSLMQPPRGHSSMTHTPWQMPQMSHCC